MVGFRETASLSCFLLLAKLLCNSLAITRTHVLAHSTLRFFFLFLLLVAVDAMPVCFCFFYFYFIVVPFSLVSCSLARGVYLFECFFFSQVMARSEKFTQSVYGSVLKRCWPLGCQLRWNAPKKLHSFGFERANGCAFCCAANLAIYAIARIKKKCQFFLSMQQRNDGINQLALFVI